LEHPEFGARPLIEQIEADIEEPLSNIINSNQVEKGSNLIVSVENGQIVFDAQSLHDAAMSGFASNGSEFYRIDDDSEMGFEIIDPD
jgi:hypothetical protein